MPYEITITQITKTTSSKQGEYGVVDQRPWTEKELEDARGYDSKEKFLERKPLKDILAYRPNREVTETVSTEMLKQTVESLDLAAVNKAINDL